MMRDILRYYLGRAMRRVVGAIEAQRMIMAAGGLESLGALDTTEKKYLRIAIESTLGTGPGWYAGDGEYKLAVKKAKKDPRTDPRQQRIRRAKKIRHGEQPIRAMKKPRKWAPGETAKETSNG